ncbi:stalk domain-containing protein [Abditibacterium utsteinense]|nr:stalk domain-containing protein [Abditibacterium utsteinense]
MTNQAAPGQVAPIAVNIDGRVSAPDPAPLLEGGAVFVPLRGVLENLGAKVEYFPAEKRIDITQNGKKYLLRPGVEGATIDAEVVPLAASKVVAGRAFVPLRSLAELFGYRVAWLAAQRTVAIYTNDSQKPIFVDHRAELRAAGTVGVEINFVDKTPEQIGALLDSAKQSGVGLIKTRFDWATLQPTRDSEFQWTQYDTVVREARARGLRLVGILGDATQWASIALSQDPDAWRHSPIKDKELPAWSNYVKRVVGRYKVDVQAWQVWENPSAQYFRSVARNYRQLARLAVDAARESDANAIIHAAEPGGVELDFIHDLTTNGLTPLLDGVQVYPVAGWQPGVRNPAVNFVLPYATLRDKLQVNDGKTRDYWIGGVSAPATELKSGAVATAAQQKQLSAYSPTAQADYLVQMFALGLASGTGKVFWNSLQDEPEAATSNSSLATGTGLLRADGTPRPALSALQQVSANLRNKPYAGNLSFSRQAVALLFDDKKSGTLVAWSPDGDATLALNSSGTNSQLPGAIYVATRPDSLVTDPTGATIAPAAGVLKLSNRPIFITNVALETATLAGARLDDKSLRLSEGGASYAQRGEVKADFGPGGEDGLFWRQYSGFGGMARQFAPYQGKTALITEAQTDIFDLNSSRPFIYFDVADDFMYFAGGAPVTISVTVRRTQQQSSSIVNTASSFRVEYDSPSGYKTTPLQVVESGEGWVTYSFDVPDASFANAEGYDLLINTGGSKSDIMFGSVSVKRGTTALTPEK